jgi:hypothetical protein
MLDRQKRAWERFDKEAKQLEADLMLCQVEHKPLPSDARERLGECAALADKIVRLSGSAAAKSALGERLAALNTKINSASKVSFGKGLLIGVFKDYLLNAMSFKAVSLILGILRIGVNQALIV